jgi:hypothetical protein
MAFTVSPRLLAAIDMRWLIALSQADLDVVSCPD